MRILFFFSALAIGTVIASTYTSEVSDNQILDIKSVVVDSVLVQQDTFFDEARKRSIPICNYFQKNIKYKGWVIFSHGYGGNNPESYMKYAYLTKGLAEKGYFVTSIQHEEIGDPFLPTKGDMQQLRLPFWTRGSANIDFVQKQLLFQNKFLADLSLIVIGHSNGGDISAQFTVDQPGKVSLLITLDNWRRSLQDINCEGLLTIRASDSKTDKEVFENWDKRKTQNVQIVNLPVKHSDMNDKGTEEQKMQILRSILVFLESN